MSSFARNQCSLHKGEFDSFCFLHNKSCCSVCHAKISASCDILCTEQAESRLRDEISSAAQTMDDVMQKILEKQKVITAKRRDLDQVGNDNLASVKSFYDSMIKSIKQCENRACRAIETRTADQSEKLREAEEQANNMVEAIQEIKTSIGKNVPRKTGDQERSNNNNILSELYLRKVDILETAGCGEHVLTSVSEMNVKNPDIRLTFAGCLNDIAKITGILDGLSVSECAQEGAAVSNTSAPMKQTISKLFKVKEFTKQNLDDRFSGKIVAMENSAVVILTAGGKTAHIAEAAIWGYGKGKVDKEFRFSDQIVAMTYVSHVEQSDIVMLMKDDMLVRMDSDGQLMYCMMHCIMRSGPRSKYMIPVPVIRVKSTFLFVPSETEIIIYMLESDRFQRVHTVPVGKAVHSFDLLISRYIYPDIVVYDESSSAITKINHAGVERVASPYTFGGYTVTHISVPPAEDRVIFMASLQNLRVKVVILSKDLQQLLKSLEWTDVSLVGACVHSSNIYLSSGDLSSVKHYDTDGNYKETLLTGLQQIKGITCNEKSKQMAILSHPSSSTYNIVMYKIKA